MTELEELILNCLETDAARESSPMIIELERRGDVAYTVTKNLITSGRVRTDLLPAAFRCLAAISSHQGIARASDLLNAIIPFTHHPDRAVRTTAAHQIVWSGFSENRAGAVGVVACPTKASLVDAVRTALSMGVEDRFRASFEQYLSSKGADTEEP
jgi:hypothetical protein